MAIANVHWNGKGIKRDPLEPDWASVISSSELYGLGLLKNKCQL